MHSNPEQSYNARLGLWLCTLYGLFYAGFVLVNAFASDWVKWRPLAGINLALWWGFSLIGLACLLAVIYGVVCKPNE
jgi:uncharacterized membrane protein (DUF485 family)